MMARTQLHGKANLGKGSIYESGGGYKYVMRKGSKFGWVFENGKIRESRGGFDTPEEAAYNVDEFLIAYIGPDAETNQALGMLKEKHVLAIREKISKAEKAAPATKTYTKHKASKSGFKGVYPAPSKRKPWMAQLAHNNKVLNLGCFPTVLEAARAYDVAAIRHKGLDAVTNLSMGLVPPIGQEAGWIEPPRIDVKKAIRAKGKAPEPIVTFIPPEPVEDEDKQPEFNGNNSPIPDCIHSSAFTREESEREQQIIAARSMLDIEDADGETLGNEPEPEPEARQLTAPVEVLIPAPAAPAIIEHEVMQMTDAEKLRAKAEDLLRRAAEIDAGNVKQMAREKLETLTSRLNKMQNAMLTLIDHCAEIETEIQDLKALLK